MEKEKGTVHVFACVGVRVWVQYVLTPLPRTECVTWSIFKMFLLV